MPSNRLPDEFEFDFTVIRETEVWTCSTGDIDWQFLSNQADSEIGLLHDCNGNEFEISSDAMVRYLPMLLNSEDIAFRKRARFDVNGGIACRSNAMAILKCTGRDQYLQMLSEMSKNTF